MSSATLIQCGVLAFCTLIFTASLLGLVFPSQFWEQLRSLWQMRFAMPLAVAARLVLGTMLIVFAPESRYPPLFRILGVLGLVAAVGLLVAGWQRIDAVMGWLATRPTYMMRASLVAGVLLGAVLFYGAI